MRIAPYRGKDIGSRRDLELFCLKAFVDGRADQLLEILPHVSLLKSPSFIEPLSALLRSRDPGKQIFAALALGSIGAKDSVDALLACFLCPNTFESPSTESLQAALILALGETGCESAAKALSEILDFSQSDRFTNSRCLLVATSFGILLQFDVEEALGPLLRLSGSSAASVRGHAVTELGVAYWHRPRTTPACVLKRMRALVEDPSPQVRNAALASLYNLAELGCAEARQFFRKDEKQLA